MSENVSLFRLNCNCPHIQAFQEGAFLAHRVIGSRTSSAGNTRAAWWCQVPLPGIGTDSTSACRHHTSTIHSHLGLVHFCPEPTFLVT